MLCATDEFNVYTREAGAGQLSIAVEGPSKATMDVVDRGNGYTTVGYVVSKPGMFSILSTIVAKCGINQMLIVGFLLIEMFAIGRD